MATYTKMSKSTPTGSTGTYASGKKYREFKNLANINNTSSSYAVTNGKIGGKSTTWNRPSTITLKNFGFSIPEYEDITSIKITINHFIWNQTYPSPTIIDPSMLPNIGAPTIKLLNTGSTTLSQKIGAPGQTWNPSQSYVTEDVTTTFTTNLDNKYVNSSAFGLTINYPANTNSMDGYLGIRFVSVTITTKKSAYTFNIQKTSINDIIVNETVSIKFTITNTNLTKYNPQILISLPSYIEDNTTKFYLEYIDKESGDGTISKGSDGNLYWNAGLNASSKTKTCTLKFNCLKMANNIFLTINESKYSLSTLGKYTFNILDAPMTVSHNELDSFIVKGSDLTIKLTAIVPKFLTLRKSCIITFTNCEYDSVDTENPNVTISENEILWNPDLINNLTEDLVFTINNISNISENNIFNFSINTDDEGNLYNRDILIIPINTGKPFYTCLQLSDEEKNRMGDGYSYIVGSLMKINYEDDEELVDYGTNFRIGVYHQDPSIIFFDECNTDEKSTNYIDSHVSINYENQHKIIESNLNYLGEYYYAHQFNNSDLISLEFIIYNNLNTDMENTSIIIGDKSYPLSYFNIDFDDDYQECKLRLEWDYYDDTRTDKVLSVYKDDEVYCLDDGITFITNKRVGFNVQNSILEISDIYINELDESKIYDNLYDKAYENCDNWSNWLEDYENVNRVTTNPVTFNSEYPFIIIFTGESINMSPIGKELVFSTPFVVENGTSKASTESAPINGLYPLPIKNIITGEDILINFNNNNTEEIILYDFKNLSNVIGDEKAIIGITITVDVVSDEDVDIIAFIKPEGVDYEESGRSIKVTSNELYQNPTVTLGGNFDDFGIDFMNNKPEDFEVGLKFSCRAETTITVSNINIEINYNVTEEDKVHCIVDDTDLRYYGFIITSLKVPFGVDTETSYLTIGGSDINKAYRMNIKEKEIEIKFRLEDCDIISSTEAMEEIAKIFTNKRDTMNKPIPKTISFNHFPNVYWNFINEESIDAEAEFVDYEGTIKLKVPDGTSYSINPEVTVNVGKIGGLARVKPIITLNNLTNDITVTESNTKQVFKCKSDTFYSNDELEINCQDRILYQYITPENIITGLYYNDDDDKLYEDSSLTQEVQLINRVPENLLIVETGTSKGSYRYINTTIGYVKVSDKIYDEDDIQKQIPINRNECVDWSSDWFILDDEYTFTGIAGDVNTCNVIEVLYYERK